MSAAESLDVQSDGDIVIAALSGEIDLANAGAIRSLIVGAIGNDAAGLVLDLSGTTYLDSSGVHLVFDLAERLSARQQRLVLVVPEGARVRRVLDIVKVDSVVPLLASVEDAKDLARTGPAGG